MVSFDLCEGIPGALAFMAHAYREDIFAAEAAFARMDQNGIRGCDLYMLWNDCCDRNTRLALIVMRNWEPDKIREKINRTGGRGIPITQNEVVRYA